MKSLRNLKGNPGNSNEEFVFLKNRDFIEEIIKKGKKP